MKEIPKSEIKELSGALKELLAGGEIKPEENLKEDERKIRIREISLSGKFSIDTGEIWVDYDILNSADPFTVLFLDSDSWREYSDETVRHHFKEVSKFLSHCIRLENQGINQDDSYPLLNPEKASRNARTAFDLLSTSSKREKEYQRIVDDHKKRAKPILDGLLRAILSDHKLTISESKEFIQTAGQWRFSEQEAADYLFKAIEEKKYIPTSHVEEDWSNYKKLISSDWMSADELKSSKVDFRLGFGDDGSIVITNLKDLGSYCYENMKTALNFISSGRLVASLTPYFPVVADNIADIIKRNKGDEERQYIEVIYTLNPSLPFRLREGVELKTEHDLIEKVFSDDATLLNQVVQCLKHSQLQIWWKLRNERIEEIINTTRAEITSFDSNSKVNSISKSNKSVASSEYFSRELLLSVLYKLDGDLPYFFRNTLKFNSVKELAEFLLIHPPATNDEISGQFDSGILKVWLNNCSKADQNLKNRILELSGNAVPKTINFSKVIAYALYPDQVFRFPGLFEIKSIEELYSALESHKVKWSEVRDLLSDRTLYYWIKFNGGDVLLSKYEEKCNLLRSRGLFDDDTAVDALLRVSNPDHQLKLAIEPDSVVLGSLARGASKKITLKIKKHGIGHIAADVSIVLVSVQKSKLKEPQLSTGKMIIPFDQDSSEVSINIENNGDLGSTIKYAVRLRSNYEDNEIPVSYNSQLPVGLLLANGFVGAIIIGSLFALSRLLVTWVTGNFAVFEFEEPSFGVKWISDISQVEWKLFASLCGFFIVAIVTYLYISISMERVKDGR